MQINRLFEIVYILLNKKNTTAKELAEHFEVSQRTIYRDIDTLNIAGIPIYTSKGKGGGIGLLENFILNKSMLSEQEQNDILSALKGLHAASYPEAEQVLSKLSVIFNKSAANWIEVDFSDWSYDDHDKFGLVKSAILQKQTIAFEYFGRDGGKTSRVAEPFQLWFKHKAWYVRAFCLTKQDERLFKFSRMKNCVLTGEEFHNGPLPALTAIEQLPAPMVTVTLKIDPLQTYRVFDEFDERHIEKQQDGSFVVTGDYVEDEWVYGYILSFGHFAQVLAPAHIRDIIREKLKRMLADYS